MAKKKKRRGAVKPSPPSRTLISVAMIARNEENHLVAAMQSANRFADEVILVDTGSTDRTIAVARSLGMKVHRFKWIHDFAAARNESFRHCRGKYVFWQDPDETVPEECATVVRELAELGLKEDVDEFRMLTALNGTYRPPEEDIPGYGPGFRVLKPRMLKNCRDIDWVNRIHESTHWSRSIRRRDIGEEVWVLNHGNASQHDTATGDDYYYALMVLGHRDNPNDPHYSLYLAEAAIIRELNSAKGLQYLDTIKDPAKLGSPELEEKYWVMRGRAFKQGAINAHDQGFPEPASRQAAEALKNFDRAVRCKGSHSATLEGATLVLHMGGRDNFVQIVDSVLTDQPGHLMAQYFKRLADLEEDPQKLSMLVGNWLFNLRNNRTMEESFEMVTTGNDPQQPADVEGAWGDEQGERKVVIVIVYRCPDDQPERRRNLHACFQAVEPQGATIVLVEQDSERRFTPGRINAISLFDLSYEPFNRGKAFNFGVAHSGAQGNDLLCLMDADMLVDPLWVSRCLDQIAAAEKSGRLPGVLLPYTAAIYMDTATTAAAIEAGDPGKVETIAGETFHSQGGCIWITAELYEQVGGHDDRYVGWGSADRDFYQRIQTHLGQPPPRLDQPLYHMDHPAPDKSRVDANSEIFAQSFDVPEEEAARQ